ncbi:hypothetical protein [Escherichia coli]|uniref:hypothetical protein n=1 Tax=Escherichia coli TaxID=562 RepID=UPI0018E4A073|nr:hypothetical protein [Escherichia coli]
MKMRLGIVEESFFESHVKEEGEPLLLEVMARWFWLAVMVWAKRYGCFYRSAMNM